MEKLDIYFKILFAAFIIGFISLIVYVSLLGDNHKIDFAVEQYFQDIKTRDYNVPCERFDLGDIEHTKDCHDTKFLLETAFLMKYGLIEADDYSLEIKKSHFWIPWISNETVTISVAMIPKHKNFVKAMFGKSDVEFVDAFMTVQKVNKLWKIQSISLQDRSLASIFIKIQNDINLSKYITRSENGYMLNETHVNPEAFSPVERRLFDYSMSRLSGL